MGKALSSAYGNPMGMEIGYKIGNGNGKEWESIAREWEGVGMQKNHSRASLLRRTPDTFIPWSRLEVNPESLIISNI